MIIFEVMIKIKINYSSPHKRRTTSKYKTNKTKQNKTKQNKKK
jgi:hypothetical protein